MPPSANRSSAAKPLIKIFLIRLRAVQVQETQETERVHAVKHFSLFRFFFCQKRNDKHQIGDLNQVFLCVLLQVY